MPEQHNYQRVVEFLSDGLKIRGQIRLPEGSGPHPMVILGHGLGGLKEWTLPDVVKGLVHEGIAGFWFDYRNVGDSEGQPRDEVSHYGRIEDWLNAISFASSLSEIDPQRIGIWGTSLGGRDVLAAASIDRRVKAVLAQAPVVKWVPTVAARMAGFGDNIDQYYRDLEEDRKNRSLGKEPRYLPFVRPSGDDVKGDFIHRLTSEERRNYTGRLTLQTYKTTFLPDVTPLVPSISPIPVGFILAERDVLPGQQEAFEAAKEPKSLFWVSGHHFSPYMESKNESIKATREFFTKYLLK